MKRILLDTSVYGRLVTDRITLQNVEKKQELHQIIIYGARIIRQELRETPKSTTLEGKKLRTLLLGVYDSLIKKDHHNLSYNKLVNTLSEDYFEAYRKEGGSLSNQEMKNDFIIIATATIYQLDVVVSDDERSMFSDKAVRAYEKINKGYGMKNPIFKTYATFKKELSKITMISGISRRSFQYDT